MAQVIPKQGRRTVIRGGLNRGQVFLDELKPTAALEAGDRITVPGVGCWAALLKVEHLPSGETELTYDYEAGFHRRRAVRRRKTSGKTTVHVRHPELEG
jgi:hypothetical protein